MNPRLISLTVACAVLIPGVAFAQSTASTANDNSASQSSQSLPQQIQQKLTNQGFTDVKVVPGSFLVSAKDKQGDPVTMIIGPNSMTVFTMSASGAASSTTGSSIGQSEHSGSK